MAIQIVKGAVKVEGVPDVTCFTTFTELLRSLGTYLTVEIPNQNFSNIVISNSQPGAADANKIWWRISNSGAFIGIYTYANNIWNQVLPAPNQIFWLYGDSDNPPPGFSFDAVAATLSAPDYAELIALAVPNGGPAPYRVYPALFTSF